MKLEVECTRSLWSTPLLRETRQESNNGLMVVGDLGKRVVRRKRSLGVKNGRGSRGERRKTIQGQGDEEQIPRHQSDGLYRTGITVK